MGEMTNAQGTSAQTSSWECKTAIDPEALINYFGENFNQIFFSPHLDFSVMATAGSMIQRQPHYKHRPF